MPGASGPSDAIRISLASVSDQGVSDSRDEKIAERNCRDLFAENQIEVGLAARMGHCG
jgi:hypothetical protein